MQPTNWTLFYERLPEDDQTRSAFGNNFHVVFFIILHFGLSGDLSYWVRCLHFDGSNHFADIRLALGPPRYAFGYGNGVQLGRSGQRNGVVVAF